MTRSSELPEAVQHLLDGTGLADKIGTTLQLVVSDDEGWPRVASLSVGEVLATGAETILLTMYDSSRTTRALTERARGLLVLVDEGAIVKVELEASVAGSAEGRTIFRCRVAGVERDEVAYARVTHGIEFELLDGAAATARWAKQLDQLAGMEGA